MAISGGWSGVPKMPEITQKQPPQPAPPAPPGNMPYRDIPMAGDNPGVGFPDGRQFFDPSKHQMDNRYLQEMRGIAFGDPGSSPWLQYQMEQDQIRQAADLDALQRQGMSSLATQQGQMAMRGGLTSGATERMGQQNLVGMLQGQSELSRSAAAREAAYRQQAEERQRDVLTQLPSAELQYSTYGAGLDQYATDQQNQAWAASQLADAIRGQGGGSGGGPGGVIDMATTGVPENYPSFAKPMWQRAKSLDPTQWDNLDTNMPNWMDPRTYVASGGNNSNNDYKPYDPRGWF
jgi:hypothetical protein